MLKFFAAAATALFLTGCGEVSVPAQATASDGTVFYGKATASMSGGKFFVTSNSGVTCSGTYDAFSREKRLYLPISCTDGRSGQMALVRDNDLMGGEGTAELSDGTTARVIFGDKRLPS
ncbi:hypothetical protein [Marinibacterium sp. SX1]|uniref:hypothetical protein n=1 Tax=Marinibacterium sp. SX1 TaxID=3388424 RepID=UPI003D16AEC4